MTAQIQRVPIDSVRTDPANVRRHDPRNLAAIANSLLRFGQQKPIVVDGDRVVRAGNGTYEAAKDILRWTHIDVVVSDLNAVDLTAYAIADNRTAELAAWDEAALAEVLSALGDHDAELIEAAGFDDDELQALLDSVRGTDLDVVEDDVPAPPDAAITAPGNVWLLGPHRLMCGDAANGDDVDTLMDGATVQMVNTDPPYNVGVEPRSAVAVAAGHSSFAPGETPDDAQVRARDRQLKNDAVDDDEFRRLLDAWFGNIGRVLEPGRAFYAWGGYSNIANFPNAMAKAGLYFSQPIIWDKQHPVINRKDFMAAHEWGFYGWREGAAHVYFGPHNATDLWRVKKVNPGAMVHLTQKPVELAARALGYSSRPGEAVLDLFGGSGSTLIACEQTGRRSYTMEIDPLYCDVIVSRWEAASGQKAELA